MGIPRDNRLRASDGTRDNALAGGGESEPGGCHAVGIGQGAALMIASGAGIA